MTVDILLSTYNGGLYLPEQLQSLQAQTHRDWRLWVRDDGSTDNTRGLVQSAAGDDDRIRLLPDSGDRRGAKGGFGWLLEQLSDDARYIMFCDQDDVWLSGKIEQTLYAMQAAEAYEDPSCPILVHSDVHVADAQLALIADSLWRYQGITPETSGLDALCIRNVVTGCTAMINRPLRDRSVPIPLEAIMHDWWLALVASGLGRIVHLPTPTVLYRQHRSNTVGAKRDVVTAAPLLRKAAFSFNHVSERTRLVRAAGEQAHVLMERYQDVLPREARALLTGVVQHLRLRGKLLERPRLERLRLIRAEMRSGRYHRLGNGLSSAVRDLLL
jgi:glycosyltransferase involved in cell wall biosynthesis